MFLASMVDTNHQGGGGARPASVHNCVIAQLGLLSGRLLYMREYTKNFELQPLLFDACLGKRFSHKKSSKG